MKWIITLLLLLTILFCGSAFGATLNLKATWTANTESDLAGYNLYRTDSGRTKINTSGLIGTTYGTSANPYLFSVTVANGTQGTLTFVLTAVDTSNNESGDSNTASFAYDSQPPAAPKNLSVLK